MTIGSGAQTIGNSAFAGCDGLTGELIIPNSVQMSGSLAFSECLQLTRITIPNSVITIEYAAFSSCSGLTEVTIGSGVQTIGRAAFAGCDGLTNITSLATTAPSIESWTFKGVPTNGILYYPVGSDYSSWMKTDDYYLGYYNWTTSEITE